MSGRREAGHFVGFLGWSLLGVSVFVLLPFVDVARRSFVAVMSGKFAGFDNYGKVLSNQAFLLAVENTARFAAVGIFLLVVIGLAAALVLGRLRDIAVIKGLYLFPMAMPTATVVIVWRMFFYRQNFDSLVASYLWKNVGYTMVLWLAGIAAIPKEQIEAAKVDGADGWQRFWHIKLPCLKRSLYTIVILSFINSFKIYREAYLAAGAYPGKEMYLLQHLFSNWYVNLELDKLSAATVLVGGFLFGCIMILNHFWNQEE